jgi:HAD superfamily hydrolase (TIGR01457 family)
MKHYAGYIFDLDGTVYRGGKLIAGAGETLARLRARGARVVFLSNNPTYTREQYAAKLTRLGVPCGLDEVANSSYAIIRELKRDAPSARLYVVGEQVFVNELRQAGLAFAATPEETDIVVLAFDRTFHYGKWHFAHQALKRGAQLWATNPDRTCPTEDGDTPDCGSLIPAIETSSGRKLDRMTGKPSAAIVRVAAELLGLPIRDCLMVGDRLETDVLMGHTAGCDTAVVLTGITTRDMLAKTPIKPDYVLESIAELA